MITALLTDSVNASEHNQHAERFPITFEINKIHGFLSAS